MAIKKVMYVAYVSDEVLAQKLLELLRASKRWWKFYTKYYGDNSSEPIQVNMEEGRE